ncbi:hypothetical protein EON78_03115 [bacterium]|nr:MAG: hypothetical protein EON78_03115 [bacterium]
MDNFYLFLGVGAFLIYLILQFDKEQRRRLKRISKLSRNVEPLLLQQSVGKKLSVLQSALARFETATSIATHEQMPYVTISKQLYSI